MIDKKVFVVLSGIPASGKTSLAPAIGTALSIPVLDKDDILEALFDSLGTGDMGWRQKLSRASDAILQRVAISLESAVICSFWHHPQMEGTSGTSIEWLNSKGHAILEVYCRCEPTIAADRFTTRKRHPGHLDPERHIEQLTRQFEQLATFGPLHVGELIELDTSHTVDPERLVQDIRDLAPPNGPLST